MTKVSKVKAVWGDEVPTYQYYEVKNPPQDLAQSRDWPEATLVGEEEVMRIFFTSTPGPGDIEYYPPPPPPSPKKAWWKSLQAWVTRVEAPQSAGLLRIRSASVLCEAFQVGGLTFHLVKVSDSFGAQQVSFL